VRCLREAVHGDEDRRRDVQFSVQAGSLEEVLRITAARSFAAVWWIRPATRVKTHFTGEIDEGNRLRRWPTRDINAVSA
jgi:hypothetical protein